MGLVGERCESQQSKGSFYRRLFFCRGDIFSHPGKLLSFGGRAFDSVISATPRSSSPFRPFDLFSPALDNLQIPAIMVQFSEETKVSFFLLPPRPALSPCLLPRPPSLCSPVFLSLLLGAHFQGYRRLSRCHPLVSHSITAVGGLSGRELTSSPCLVDICL